MIVYMLTYVHTVVHVTTLFRPRYMRDRSCTLRLSKNWFAGFYFIVRYRATLLVSEVLVVLKKNATMWLLDML